jgi:ribosome biogenesis protein BRX1
VQKDPLQPKGPPQTSLVEIGPRFVLTPIRIFEGAFGGATVFSNPGKTAQCWSKGNIYCCTEFISPAAVRSAMKREKGIKYGVRKESQEESLKRKELRRREEDELAVPKVFA